MAVYGTSILMNLAMPYKNAPPRQIAPLLGTILFFLSETRLLPSNDVGGIIEQLKSRYLHSWVKMCAQNHPQIYTSALMPNPAEELKMFGHWDYYIVYPERLRSRLDQLLLLATYGLLSLNDWVTVLPFYCEQTKELTINTRSEDFKGVSESLCKLLESDLSALPFDSDQMWSFLSCCSREKAMDYLAALTRFNVVIPFKVMIDLYGLYLAEPHGDENDDLVSQSIDDINDNVIKIGLIVVDQSERRPSIRPNPRHETNQILQIFEVLNSQIKLRDGAVLSTNKILMLCCSTIKRIETRIVEDKNCIKLIQMVKKMVQVVFMSKNRDNDENGTDPHGDVSTKNSEADGLSPALQLFYRLLCILKRGTYASKEMAVICSDILELLTSKATVLETLRALPESHRQYVDHSHVIPYLWTELGESDCRARNASKVILQYLYHFSTSNQIISLIDSSVASRNWKHKFALADKLAALLMQVEPSGMMRCSVVCYVVSYSICLLISLLDESEPALTRRTKYLIDGLSKRSLAAICSCFEFQFRNIISDRVIILRKISKLHQLRPDGKVLTWSFFTQAFNIITTDALVCAEIGKPFCLSAKYLLKHNQQISQNNSHYNVARDYRSTNEGASTTVFPLSKKIRPNNNQTVEEMDKEAIVELISRVCVFMVEGE